MKIDAHIICWNREDTILKTIKHYGSFCDEIFIYDNFSEDNTREIAEQAGAKVSLFGTAGVLSDEAYLTVKNNCWKHSKADWVIIVDDDEIFYHPDIKTELQLAKDSGATIIQPKGWGVFSYEMPERWLDTTFGMIDENYDKMCCFSPRLEGINYIFGCHQAKPKGQVRIVRKCWLLHYRAVGGPERLIARHQQYEPRRKKSAVNMRWDLGGHYRQTVENPNKTKEWFESCYAKSMPLPEVIGF